MLARVRAFRENFGELLTHTAKSGIPLPYPSEVVRKGHQEQYD